MLRLIFVVVLVGCAKDSHIKKTEYKINDVWRECSQAAQEACGVSLNCGGEFFKCMNNVEVRSR